MNKKNFDRRSGMTNIPSNGVIKFRASKALDQIATIVVVSKNKYQVTCRLDFRTQQFIRFISKNKTTLHGSQNQTHPPIVEAIQMPTSKIFKGM